MGSSLSLVLLLAVLAAAFAWLLGRPGRGRPTDPRRDADDDDLDRAALEQAESEIEDLGPLASPEDAEEDLPDWGPGAPKP